MRVRAHDGGHAAIQVPAHSDLLGGRLGVHVDEDVLDLVELSKRDLDLREGRAASPQVEVSAEVDHTQAYAVVLDHTDASAGLAAQEVGRTHDRLARVQVRVDLAAVIRVVAQRDRVDAGGEHLLGDLRRDAQATGGVLAVDDDECGLVALAQRRQAVEQRAPADAADDVTGEQDASLARDSGSRLRLSHTLAMEGGR
jgi:hypothetical protein